LTTKGNKGKVAKETWGEHEHEQVSGHLPVLDLVDNLEGIYETPGIRKELGGDDVEPVQDLYLKI
jgi:hypothetical protein